MLSRKIREMTKGGYMLFSDKARKMLLSVGLSMLSVGLFANVVNAAPEITGQFKKEVENSKTIYQIRVRDTEADITKFYADTTEITGDDIMVHKRDIDGYHLVVLKVDSNVSSIKVENDKLAPDTESATLDSTALANIPTDSTGPVITWMYKNEEGRYIQFEADDSAVIYRVVGIVDIGNSEEVEVERIKVKEKDASNKLIATYKLNPNDKKFKVYDVFGNSSEVVNIDTIATKYTIAAKNTDGTKVVLNMTLPTGAILNKIETVDGVNLMNNENVLAIEKGDLGDKLVAIYKQDANQHNMEGTTFVNITYTLNDVENTFPVLLDLDLKAPVSVYRNIEGTGDGAITENGGVARLYKNAQTDKAIIEVKDILSGITKIVTCTGTGTNIQESVLEDEAFEIPYLPTSVVQMVKLPAGATYVRVYDGIGNKYDIPVSGTGGLAYEIGNTMPVELEIEKTAEGATMTLRDREAGLKKVVRAKEVDAVQKEVVIADGDKSYVPQDGEYGTLLTREEINTYYPVTEQTKNLTEAQLQGQPEFTAVDVFNNTTEFNLNDILFNKDYVIKDLNGNDQASTTSIAVKVQDIRRVKKITAEVDGVEKILEVFELGTNATGDGPCEVTRVYDIGNNVNVTKVTVYHYNDDTITQNVLSGSDIETMDKTVDNTSNVRIDEYPDSSGEYDVWVRYGIKKINYSDGREIEFFEELPTLVNVPMTIEGVDELSQPVTISDEAIITDAFGRTYSIKTGSEDLTTYRTPQP